MANNIEGQIIDIHGTIIVDPHLTKKLSYDEVNQKLTSIANDLWKDMIGVEDGSKHQGESLPYIRNSCIKYFETYAKEEREIIMQKIKLVEYNIQDSIRSVFTKQK